MTSEERIQLLIQEQQVVRNQMLNKGLSFDIPRLSILRFLPGKKDKSGKRVSTVTLYKPYLKTMDYLAELKLRLNINLEELAKNPVLFKNRAIKENTMIMAEIIAVSLLNRNWKIKIFRKMLSSYIAGRLNSETLKNISALIDEMEDAANFINSTVLMSGTARTSEPKPETIEIPTKLVRPLE